MVNVFYYENPIPHILIKNFYDDGELKLIWQELDFLTSPSKLNGPIETGSAKIHNSNIIENGPEFLRKKNHGIFLDPLYQRREISNILTLSRKIYSEEFLDFAAAQHMIFNYMKASKRDGSLLSYYENADEYPPHVDNAIITCVTWLYKEPKIFTGGDFYFSDYKHQIPIQNNTTIIFPSFIKHSVSKIHLDPCIESFSGYGRYAITNFITPY